MSVVWNSESSKSAHFSKYSLWTTTVLSNTEYVYGGSVKGREKYRVTIKEMDTFNVVLKRNN